MTHYVFVYGSLLSGLHNHRVLQSTKFLGQARTDGCKWRMLDLGSYPVLTTANDGRDVVGECYEVNDEVMKDLDRLEGYPRFYTRTPVPVQIGGTPQARVIAAWVYHLNTDETETDHGMLSRCSGCPVVPDNNWRDYYEAKTAAEYNDALGECPECGTEYHGDTCPGCGIHQTTVNDIQDPVLRSLVARVNAGAIEEPNQLELMHQSRADHSRDREHIRQAMSAATGRE